MKNRDNFDKKLNFKLIIIRSHILIKFIVQKERFIA